MNTENKLSKFKKEYCLTLQKNTHGTPYVELRFDDYEDLSCFKNNIITAIDFLATAHGSGMMTNLEKEDFPFVMKSLVRVLKDCTLFAECSGIDELIKSA